MRRAPPAGNCGTGLAVNHVVSSVTGTPDQEAAMADLTIRDLPQDELDALRARAERHGRSVEEEARHLLHEAAAEEMLVEELERATRAAEAKMAEARAVAADPPAATASPPKRRYRYEPTPRRRGSGTA